MSPPSIVVVFLILLSLNFYHEIEAKRSHLIQIFNQMPQGTSPLTIHCASKNDEFGYRPLPTGQSFSFSFRTNFWATTLFFCRFWWGGKTTAFDVFDALWDIKGYHHTYTYVVNDQGFYVGYDDAPSNHMLQISTWP
ncbi:hypothetical protein ABFX02_07G066700 [Erythranthe guttata]